MKGEIKKVERIINITDVNSEEKSVQYEDKKQIFTHIFNLYYKRVYNYTYYRVNNREHAEDLTSIISAIGNHDEHTGNPVSPISAALIIADKSDVRRSRVRKRDVNIFDIHDRVNYSIYEAKLEIDPKLSEIVLNLKLDTDYCSVIEYFEIFVGRMKMCVKAANYLGVTFSIKINGVKMM